MIYLTHVLMLGKLVALLGLVVQHEVAELVLHLLELGAFIKKLVYS